MEVIIMSDSEQVTPRKRRVSRNEQGGMSMNLINVTPRKRRVSRNEKKPKRSVKERGHASQEACE